MLQHTLEFSRDRFCPLIIEIVKTAIPYRLNKNIPITRDEIIAINKKIVDIGFKIPELWDHAFLESLPVEGKNEVNIYYCILKKIFDLTIL